MSAVPTATLPVLESALKATAVSLGTDGDPAQSGPGLIDTLAAYQATLAGAGSRGAIDSGRLRAGGDVIGPRQGVLR